MALARAVDDLRDLEEDHDTHRRRHGALHRDVWDGLLAMEQLRLQPFRKPSDPHNPHGGSGLPLGVLARVQLYTTDASGQFQGRAHSPGCQHQRPDRGLTHDYELVTVEEMLHAEDFDPCSKCGGYATRRLTDVQLAYYRAAHQVHHLARRLRWAGNDPDTAGIAKLQAEVAAWCDTSPEDEWFPTRHQVYRWHAFLRDLHQQAQRLG